MEKIFPDYFSHEAIILINKNGKDNQLKVYRVSKFGDDLTIAFLNYYDEVILGLKQIPEHRKQKKLEYYKNNIDSLSVSCYYDIEDIIYYFNVTLKESYPKRILLEGNLSSDYGLSQITKERKTEKTDSHVDWWLYKDATPWIDFKKVDDDERIVF